MAKKKKSRIDRIMDNLKEMLPEGMVPDSYLREVIEENDDFADTDAETMAEIKIQLLEEAGADLPMTRAEAETYLYDSISQEQWDSISHEDQALTSQVKLIEDSYDKTLLQIIREMPLVPVSRMLSSIVAGYLRENGVEVTPEKEEEITAELIHSLGSSFSDLAMQMLSGLDDDGEYEPGPDWEDLGISFDDLPFPQEDTRQTKKEPDHSRRRSRITKFPGKK